MEGNKGSLKRDRTAYQEFFESVSELFRDVKRQISDIARKPLSLTGSLPELKTIRLSQPEPFLIAKVDNEAYYGPKGVIALDRELKKMGAKVETRVYYIQMTVTSYLCQSISLRNKDKPAESIRALLVQFSKFLLYVQNGASIDEQTEEQIVDLTNVLSNIDDNTEIDQEEIKYAARRILNQNRLFTAVKLGVLNYVEDELSDDDVIVKGLVLFKGLVELITAFEIFMIQDDGERFGIISLYFIFIIGRIIALLTEAANLFRFDGKNLPYRIFNSATNLVLLGGFKIFNPDSLTNMSPQSFLLLDNTPLVFSTVAYVFLNQLDGLGPVSTRTAIILVACKLAVLRSFGFLLVENVLKYPLDKYETDFRNCFYEKNVELCDTATLDFKEWRNEFKTKRTVSALQVFLSLSGAYSTYKGLKSEIKLKPVAKRAAILYAQLTLLPNPESDIKGLERQIGLLCNELKDSKIVNTPGIPYSTYSIELSVTKSSKAERAINQEVYNFLKTVNEKCNAFIKQTGIKDPVVFSSEFKDVLRGRIGKVDKPFLEKKEESITIAKQERIILLLEQMHRTVSVHAFYLQSRASLYLALKSKFTNAEIPFIKLSLSKFYFVKRGLEGSLEPYDLNTLDLYFATYLCGQFCNIYEEVVKESGSFEGYIIEWGKYAFSYVPSVVITWFVFTFISNFKIMADILFKAYDMMFDKKSLRLSNKSMIVLGKKVADLGKLLANAYKPQIMLSTGWVMYSLYNDIGYILKARRAESIEDIPLFIKIRLVELGVISDEVAKENIMHLPDRTELTLYDLVYTPKFEKNKKSSLKGVNLESFLF